jgi:hypothetical protein
MLCSYEFDMYNSKEEALAEFETHRPHPNAVIEIVQQEFSYTYFFVLEVKTIEELMDIYGGELLLHGDKYQFPVEHDLPIIVIHDDYLS